jgi:dihydroorotase (multifunctional complex type)
LIADSVLTNAKAYFRGQIVDCCIAIDDGKIEKIGKETQMPKSDKKTDLHNLLVLPGLIDEHVHLRDEGRAYKEDFSTGTAAAAAGGFTTVLDMPNNDPITMSVETLKNRMRTAFPKIYVNVGFYSEFPKKNTEIKEIVAAGAMGFKLFMGCQTGGLNIDEDQELVIAFKEVASSQVPLAVHAENRVMLEINEQKLKQSRKSTLSDFLRVHTETVEQTSIQRLLKLTRQIDIQLHFCHVSTEHGLNKISEAKISNRMVTCEVTTNHLMLSTENLEQYGPLLIMAPPLRSKKNVQELWKGITNGVVDAIGSDHAPHTLDEKNSANVWDIKVGVPGLETTLPLMITAVKKNKLTINKLVELLAEKPARIFGLKDRGVIEQGKNADLTVIDFNRLFRIDASKFNSKAKFSPYNEWEVYGKPMRTFVNGKLVFEDNDIITKSGTGSVIRRGTI